MVLVGARNTFSSRTNFFFFKKKIKIKNKIKKIWNIKNTVWVVEFLIFNDPVAFILGKWKGVMYGPCI